jgi:GT2 family glycosyltransferase
VELGTHYGTSFWSFCQAAKDEKLATELNAVDTWKGEGHAGFYGEEVFEAVKAIKKEFYSDLKIDLIRKNFDETIPDFDDKSIDLLHIDGLHTYEAVKHDFENWNSKVKDDGIIIFHDTFVRQNDFGVYKLWEELKNEYKTAEFYHSYGLGVIFKDGGKYKDLLKREKEWQMRYSFLSENRKDFEIGNISKNIRKKDELVKKITNELKEKKKEIKSAELKLWKKEREKIKIQHKNYAEKKELGKLQNKLEQKEREVNFMKSSKFWILRSRYVKMKSFRPKHLKEMAKKAHSVFRREGAKSFFRHLCKYSVHGRDYFKPEKRDFSEYDAWIDENEKWNRKEIEREIDKFRYKPKISIITPVYNVKPKWLNKCIQSVLSQFYENWELCLYDDASTKSETKRCLKSWEDSDPRIKITFGKKNQHISGASNEALKMATGEFVALLDNDDELSPDALFENVKVLNEYPETDFIYSDEDKIDIKGDRSNPFFKPNWSPDLFHSVNYICHFSVMRKSIGDEIGWFRKGYEGSQDFDLFLRFIDKTKKILHIPKVLYHWRTLETSTAKDTKSKNYAHRAGHQALADYIHRNNLKAKVADGFGDTNHHLVYDVPEGALVSIIIPFKDKVDYLKKCVESIIEKTFYKNYELILVSNNSEEKETFDYLETLKEEKNVKIFEHNIPFNFSALNNWAVEKALGDYILFLNNDTEVISPVWLEEMLGHAARPEIGAVGAKLLFPDGRIQHSGVILGMGGLADHLFSGQYADETYYALANFARNYLAVTAACLMISKDKFLEIGGFDEKFTVCGNDVDLCLKLYEKGYANVYTPRAELYHYESLSRDKNPPQCDIDISFKRYAPYLNWKDPYYNKNLALDAKDARLNISPDSREKISRKEAVQEESAEEKCQKKRFEEQKNIISAIDVSPAELKRHFEVIDKWKKNPAEVKTINWLLPNYSHVLFGGIYTILRFAGYFQTKKEIQNRIVIFDNPSEENVKKKREEAAGEFPDLREAEFLAISGAKDLPESDAVVSTFWLSCYISARFNKTKKKFYFIQDYEPLFYSAGSMYAMAEATYRMGFKGIVNTPGLAEYVRQQHDMDCREFFPCVNEKIYNINEEDLQKKLGKKTLDIFIYGRPNHDRNAFELALLTLTKLKEKYKDKINIISAGEDWREEDFGVKGVIRNLGRLESLNAVADLYRKCDIGLVFMFTKHPSYQPFEFMACGCATVTNFNGANTWFLKDGENAMVSEPEPSCLVDKISKLIEDKGLRGKIVKNGLKEIKKHNWDEECEKIFEYIQK